jgi:serum/glucocorticoid-regulated kinase 2
MLGNILYELLVGLPPFYYKDRERLFKAIRSSEPEFPSDLSEECIDLMENLLIKDPKARLGTNGVEEVKKHPWFESIDWDALEKKELKAPFVPNLRNEADTKYIDTEFTKLAAEDSARNASLMDSATNKQWKGFTYEDTKVCQ